MANEIITDAGIVTLNGMTNTVIISGDTYTGTAYKQDQLAQALSDKQTIAAQDVTLSEITVSNRKKFVGDTIIVSNRTATYGGAINNLDGTVSVISGTFSDNKGTYGGAIANRHDVTGSILTVADSIFSGNVAENSGGAIVTYGTCTAVITGSTFTGNTSGLNYGAIFNGGTVDISGCVFDGNAGGAIYTSDFGTTTLRDNVFVTASDTIFNRSGRLILGGTIRTAANISSLAAITVEKDTQLVLDLSVYGGTSGELLTNFDALFGVSQSNLTISINARADQAEGNYVLATNVRQIAQKDFTVTLDGDVPKSFDISIGDSAVFDSKLYLLKQQEGILSLCVKSNIPAGIVTTTGGTSVVVDETLYCGKSYAPDLLVTALAENAVVVAQGVTLADFAIASGRTFIGDGIAISSGTIYNSGTTTIRNGVFAAMGNTLCNDGGSLTLGGTISTAANITSTNAVTVEKGTKLMLDLSVYEKTIDGALLKDFNTLFGASQNNLTISLNIAATQEYGKYFLASGVGTLTQRNFTVTVDGDAQKRFSVTVGGEMMYGSKNYKLSLNNGALAFEVASVPAGIVTKNGSVSTVTIDGAVYSGKAYEQSELDQAFAENKTVAVQNVTLDDRLRIQSGKTFAADQLRIHDQAPAHTNAAAIDNSGTTTIVNSTFSNNSISAFLTISRGTGGAVYNSNVGTLTFKSSVFNGNGVYSSSRSPWVSDGGAIFTEGRLTIEDSTLANNRAEATTEASNGNLAAHGGALCISANTTTVSGSTFTGNSVYTITHGSGIIGKKDQSFTYGGAVYNNATAIINGCVFDRNNAKSTYNAFGGGGAYGGAIYNKGSATISGSTFKQNTANFGGAIYNEGTAMISTSVFTGNEALRHKWGAGCAGAVYNTGTATIRDSVFSTETDMIYNTGILILGGTIRTFAGIESNKTVTVSGDLELQLDISICEKSRQSAYLVNYDTAFADVENDFVLAVNVAKRQATGTFVLARNASRFNGALTIVCEDRHSETITVGEEVGFNGYRYKLSKTDDAEILLTVFSQSGVVTADGTSDTVTIGGISYTGDKYKQSEIARALDECDFVAAQDVTLEGFTVTNSFIGDRVTMSGNPNGAVYNQNGSAVFFDSVFATSTDTIYNDGGALAFGGNIKTAANIFSTEAIGFDKGTSLLLDLSGYTQPNTKEFLSNYDTAFYGSQQDVKITVAMLSDQKGLYALASGASKFDREITLDIANYGSISLIGERQYIDAHTGYRLAREDDRVAIAIEDIAPGNLYGGKAISSDAERTTETGLTIVGDGVYAALIGGENISGGTMTKNGASLVTISGNNQATAVVGGVYAANCCVNVNAETSVSVANGSFSNIVCAGSIAKENTGLTVNAASRLTISGGTFANAVAGGNYIQQAGGTVYGGRGTNASNTYVNITGGTFLRDIYGGNIAAKNSFVTMTNSYITGSTNIMIDTSKNIVAIGGNLIAGSSGSGQIIGSTNLTIKGNADNLRFGSKSIVCGDSHDATTAVSCVGKDLRNLSFDNFTGMIDAKVVGFDQMTFAGGSVTLAKSSRLGDVSAWNFSGNAELVFGDAINNFQGDTLSFGSFNGTQWTVMTGDDSTLANWDWAKSVSIAGQEAIFDETFGYWISTDYKFYREDNALKVAKLA